VRFFAAALLAVLACSGSKPEDATPVPAPPAPGSSTIAPMSPPQPDQRPRVVMSAPNGDAAVRVEVVATPAAVEKGLMFRQFMPADDGMLFMMGKEYDWTFWMRNTLIPLDMIFIKKDLTIGGIVENAEPRTDTVRSVGVETFYVLEVNGGWTAKHGVVAGARVRFEGVGP
jgi:hypothetical protein